MFVPGWKVIRYLIEVNRRKSDGTKKALSVGRILFGRKGALGC